MTIELGKVYCVEETAVKGVSGYRGDVKLTEALKGHYAGMFRGIRLGDDQRGNKIILLRSEIKAPAP